MFTHLFIATKITGDLANQIEQWQLAHPHVDIDDIVWLPKGNLHITLIPPWFVGEEDIDNVRKNLEKGLLYYPVDEFNTNFTLVDLGPEKQNPRFVMAYGDKTDDIKPLKQIATRYLGNSGPYIPGYPYIPIASFLGPIPKDIADVVDWKYHIKNFSLMRSSDPNDSETFEVVETYRTEERL